MKLSTRARYGLRALIDLGTYSEEETVSLQSIANRQNISFSYLEQLIAKLKKAGLVESTRGALGGYRLGKPAEEISVGDVLRVLEGSLDAVACTGDSEGGSCVGADGCVTRAVWKRINDSITSAVDSLMLSELIEDSKRCRDRLQQSGANDEPISCSDRYIINTAKEGKNAEHSSAKE
jgi:Rrf2 family protein